jgi:hypothetical protein
MSLSTKKQAYDLTSIFDEVRALELPARHRRGTPAPEANGEDANVEIVRQLATNTNAICGVLNDLPRTE